MVEQNKRKSLSFETIDNLTDLKRYLDSGTPLNSSKYFYQYTTVSALVNMLRSQTMHLSNAKYMNDQLEYENGASDIWANLFFTCFMMEEDESIGMWSMYAQPWRDGIKISIPKEILRRWIKDTKEFVEVSQKTKEATGRKFTDTEKFKIWTSAVAYSNLDGIDLKSESETLRCGGQQNQILKDVPHSSEMTGYIKDVAWSYEKEVRVKVQFDNSRNFERIAISLPDYVIDSMVITPSPLFEGDLKHRLETEVARQMTTNSSKFVGKLSIRSTCDDCSIRARMLKVGE